MVTFRGRQGDGDAAVDRRVVVRDNFTRSRRWLPGGGSHHPFLYRKPDEVIDLTAVDELVGSMREVIDLVAEEQNIVLPVRRRRVDPFDAARRTPQSQSS